jgi:Prokaryotic E2 family E
VNTKMNTQLLGEVEELQSRGLALQLHDQSDGWTFVVIESYPLTANLFNQKSTDLLIKVPPAYPLAGLDMFWSEPSVRLANGALPASTNLEQPLGRDWLRFSWHPSGWRPSEDNLINYLSFIDQRLHMGS